MYPESFRGWHQIIRREITDKFATTVTPQSFNYQVFEVSSYKLFRRIPKIVSITKHFTSHGTYVTARVQVRF